MPSLKRNERVASLECSREYTRFHGLRHRKHCGVLKRSNSNFYTNSSEELTKHIKQKRSSCQQIVRFCAQQSVSKHTEFLLNLKNLYICDKFEKVLVKI